MSDAIEVTREQALAYRIQAQGLDRSTAEAKDLDLWDLGLQDAPAGSARLSLAARLPGGLADVPDLTDARSWTSVWATRGAPIVLRHGDEARIAAALWPTDDADAIGRLAGNGQQFRKHGTDPIEAIRTTAKALRAAVKEPTTKGKVSEKISPKLPAELITWCKGCQAHHLGDQLMRLAGLPAGLRLVPDASPATLTPIAGWKGAPRKTAGLDALVLAYLHLHGPASAADVAAYLGNTQKPVKGAWPDGLAAVSVDGRKAWIPEDDVGRLEHPDRTDVVRLLPRSDPWLMSKDRDVIVPDKAAAKVLWPAIGWPSAVLAGTEVVAAWRTKATAKQLTLTVQPFTTLTKAVKDQIAAESIHVAQAKGFPEATITYDT
ncbi:winged helix DNA-binding domain-containing protein [Aquihabitans sp. G128]|uniref:DNA glycosylase AlkZ-like family protein n=1 Tax=Aquihabitans sp. G128 TaxID=2849779 RepID=UPI001C23337A|nr:crosslink repair DNA glycosylase YcaQ family protein [Aquihabitans sp. G128]QXC59594.1 winged helix DNA-binding domain-containing protein [Aquihabitans sp. G128]